MLKFVSFDVGGTLMDYTYLNYVWNEIIPQLYALKKGLGFEKAKEYVLTEYNRIGSKDIRWYLPEYWFLHFNLDKEPLEVFRSHVDKINFYPEVPSVLESMVERHDLIIASVTPKNITEVIFEGFRHFFKHIFSPVSDFQEVKKTERFYEMICRVLKIEPSAVVHVGDDWDSDYIAPRKAGLRSFFLDRTEERTGKFVIKSLTELEDRFSNQ
ncbi:MAG: HAD family hydrolase [Candidatus Heimdallarchaeota archaeon]